MHQPLARHSLVKCLVLLARGAGIDLSLDRLIHDHCLENEEPTNKHFVAIASSAGLKCKAAYLSWKQFAVLGTSFPVIARLKDRSAVIVVGVRKGSDGEEIGIINPLTSMPVVSAIKADEFRAQWSGDVFFVRRAFSINDPQQPFGLGWFIPEIIRQRTLFINVALAALMLQIIALVVPFFFQLVIDKVLPHESYATLYVLALAVSIALLFEAIFGFLRRYLLLFATNRIDIRTATRTFGRLLLLPIAFFEHMPAGVLIRNMQQVQRIREFLSGRLFLTLLDAVSLVVFVPILFLYSKLLTLLVLAFSGAIAANIAIVLPPFRRRLQELYHAESRRQALLTECVHGMRTVKALSLEPRQRVDWDERSADAIRMQASVARISIGAQTVTSFLEKTLMVCIIILGAQEVFSGSITIGALVAFQMLAGRVSNPLVQLISLIHEYQEAALSVRMLAEVMNQAPERSQTQRGSRPAVRGNIEFSNVSFSYAPGLPLALQGISFKIAQGTFLGIVGASGSGKTTLTRLIQGLDPVNEGVLRVEGVDIREIDLVHLRHQIGVVLQENFIFRGTVRDNIAMARPDATIEQIVEAARLGGALEFIEQLPKGFDTLLEENAVNLSGGQKQRLAIARALIRNPPILILDEATSALDPESEAIVHSNLRAIAKNRTLIIVSHRLATLVEADKILVLHSGQIAGLGTHTELQDQCAPYKNLWAKQTRFMR